MSRHDKSVGGVARVLSLLSASPLSACGPVGPIPGGRLDGEIVNDAPDDWSFAEAERRIQVETRPESPYSVNTWGLTYEGRLYLVSKNAPDKQWVRNVIEDPHVRVRVHGRIHPRRAVRVLDPQEIARLERVLFEKYRGSYRHFPWQDAPPPGDPPDWFFEVDRWFFRLEAP